MIDPVKILQRAWHILWNYRTLWVFGLILALATGAGPSGNNDDNNGVQYQTEAPSFGSVQEAREYFAQQVDKLFREGIPNTPISGEEVPALLWILGSFIVFLILISIVVSVAYYVSVPAVIRMVDVYEATGTKMTVGQGFRIGWSRTGWRVFLLNLIVNLPWIVFVLILLILGVIVFLGVVNGNIAFSVAGIIVTAILLFLGSFVVVGLTIALHLLRPFFWRVCVLEDAGVRESLRRGFAMVRENWKSAGIMWLVMIGLGIVWIIGFVIAIVLSLPILVITVAIGALVAAIPGLLLVGIFSTFLSGELPWIAAGLSVLPLFLLIAFSPWTLLDSWRAVYASTVWTLTYREIKALPTFVVPPDLEPVGD